MGSSASCPKGTKGYGWWSTKCIANSGYKMSQGDGKKPGAYCGIQHSGSNCWGVTFSDGNPAWCIEGDIVVPGVQGSYERQTYFDETCHKGCMNKYTCDHPEEFGVKDLDEDLPALGTTKAEGPSVVGGGAAALFFVGGAFFARKRMKGKKAEGEIEVTGGDAV